MNIFEIKVNLLDVEWGSGGVLRYYDIVFCDYWKLWDSFFLCVIINLRLKLWGFW